MAAAYGVDAERWPELFGELMDEIEARFARPESRRRVRDFVAEAGVPTHRDAPNGSVSHTS